MRKLFEQSAETARIVDFLSGLQVNRPVSFSDLERSVGPFKLSSYQSAVRVARKLGVVVASIRGFGFQRITASQTVDRQEAHFRSIRRKAAVIQNEVEIAVRGNLTSKEQMRATQMHAAAGVIRSASIVPATNTPKQQAPAFVTPKTVPVP